MVMAVDPYAVLGVSADADHDTLVGAYRRAVKRAHPDGGGSAEQFRSVQEAWAVVGDPTRRRAFDLEREAAARRAPGPTAGPRTGPRSPGDPAPRRSDPPPWFASGAAPPATSFPWWRAITVYTPIQVAVTGVVGFVVGAIVAVVRSGVSGVETPMPSIDPLGADLTTRSVVLTGVVFALLAPFVREWVARSPRRGVLVALGVAGFVFLHIVVALVAIGFVMSMLGAMVSRRSQRWRSRHW